MSRAIALVNDVSEREYQTERGGQWDKGKGCDSFAPVGPWLVTRDEIADPQNLKLWTEVNGVRRQNGSTRTMIFDVRTLVSYISHFMTLMPGDIIATGTPPGVAHGHEAAAISQGRRPAAPVGRRPGRTEQPSGGRGGADAIALSAWSRRRRR